MRSVDFLLLIAKRFYLDTEQIIHGAGGLAKGFLR